MEMYFQERFPKSRNSELESPKMVCGNCDCDIDESDYPKPLISFYTETGLFFCEDCAIRIDYNEILDFNNAINEQESKKYDENFELLNAAIDLGGDDELIEKLRRQNTFIYESSKARNDALFHLFNLRLKMKKDMK